MSGQNNIDYQLKEASQLTDVAWSALAEREAGKWRVIAHYRLAKKVHPDLINFLGKIEVDSWLCGALSGGQSRSVSLPQPSRLEGDRLYAFPLAGVSRVVLAGADQMSGESQRLWRLVVSGMVAEDPQPATSAASSVAAS